MLLVYSHRITERVRYALDLHLRTLLGLEYDLTDNSEQYLGHQGPKFSYGPEALGDAPWFASHGLLFERGVKSQEIEIHDFRGTKMFFPVESGSALPFDVFAASFYMVTRYEEYLPFLKDEHGRFPASQSIAVQHGFLHQAVVNRWNLALKELLQEQFPELPFREKQFRFVPTYDIDIAWSYLHKGLVRTVGGYLKSVLSLNPGDFIQRTLTLVHLKKDPFYTYHYLKGWQERFGHHPIYFFLVGEFDEYDKNISITEPAFQTLIKHVADYADVGIHPSYGSNINPSKITSEKNGLEDILKRTVTQSRQHYLKLEFSRTYQRLLDLDIEDDYTLGYTSHAGFRAGICTPYYFYDLSMEMKTRLKLHPFTFMDSVFKYYRNLRPEELVDSARPYVEEVRKVGGTLYTLWHNNSFSNLFEWKGWRDPYKDLLAYIHSLDPEV